MALKILLADDSMTAQKLGKDILVGAGYEVIAVSNGAAAAKKLADKPDIVILDVFMPGYTGLELCEKVRASMDMAKTPVLLTVGKMEHFDHKDAQRVKADGVIIKPFEASDLLATVQKFEKQLAAPPAASYEKTMVFQAPNIEEFKDQSYAEWKDEATEEPPPPAAMEMSQEMGSAPAFADFDSPVEAISLPAPPPPPPAPAVDPDATVDFMAPPTTATAKAFDETVHVPPPAKPSGPAYDTTVSYVIPKTPPDLTPVESSRLDSLMEPVAPAAVPEVEFTAGPKAKDVKVVQGPSLEGGEGEKGKHAIADQDPALVTDPTEMAVQFPTKFGLDNPDDVVVGVATADTFLAAPEVASDPAPPAAPVVDDFEARVAAAMSGFKDEAVEEVAPEPLPEPVVEAVAEVAPEPIVETPPPVEDVPVYERTMKMQIPSELMEEAKPVEAPAEEMEPEVPESMQPPAGMQDAALVEQMQEAFADLPVEAAPPVEAPVAVAEIAAPAPMVATVAPPVAEPSPVPASGPDMELASALAAAMGGEPPPSALSAVPSGESATMDHATASTVVNKVLHRMMPTIMIELAKEMEAAKKK